VHRWGTDPLLKKYNISSPHHIHEYYSRAALPIGSQHWVGRVIQAATRFATRRFPTPHLHRVHCTSWGSAEGEGGVAAGRGVEPRRRAADGLRWPEGGGGVSFAAATATALQGCVRIIIILTHPCSYSRANQ